MGRRIQCIRLANDKRPVSALSCLFACIRKALRNPLGSTTPLRRRDCRAAAVHGLAPQDVKARATTIAEPKSRPAVGTSPHSANRVRDEGSEVAAGAAASLEEMKQALSHARFGQLLCR